MKIENEFIIQFNTVLDFFGDIRFEAEVSSSTEGHATDVEIAQVGAKISHEIAILALVSTHAARNVIQFRVSWRLWWMVASETSSLHRAISSWLRAMRPQGN